MIQDDTINLRALLLHMRHYWYILLISLLVGLSGGYLYHEVISTPMYQSTSMVYLRSSKKDISLESLQLSTSLAADYQYIFVSRPNLKNVISSLNLKYDEDTLTHMISVDNPSNTRILKVSVTSASNQEAKKIADAIVEEGMKDIRKLDSQSPYLVEKGNLSNERIGLTLIESMSLCGIALFSISALALTIGYFMKKDRS